MVLDALLCKLFKKEEITMLDIILLLFGDLMLIGFVISLGCSALSAINYSNYFSNDIMNFALYGCVGSLVVLLAICAFKIVSDLPSNIAFFVGKLDNIKIAKCPRYKK